MVCLASGQWGLWFVVSNYGLYRHGEGYAKGRPSEERCDMVRLDRREIESHSRAVHAGVDERVDARDSSYVVGPLGSRGTPRLDPERGG